MRGVQKKRAEQQKRATRVPRFCRVKAMCALSVLTLALFVLRVGRAHHVQATLTAHKVTLVTDFAHRSTYLHRNTSPGRACQRPL